MTDKIALLVDSGSDVPQAVIDANDYFHVVPLTVTIDGQDYQDRVNLTPDEFYTRLATVETLPLTASPAPELVVRAMQQCFDEGYTQILGITLSSGLSATHQTFRLAAQQFSSQQVQILDTKSVGIGSGLLAVYASDLINQGLAFETIVARVQQSISRSHVYFYIPTLKYLRAGGRIGKVSGLVGSALKIKPVISCDSEGIYYPVTKSRSENKALRKMVDLVAADCAGKKARIAVAHGHNPALLATVSTALEEATGQPVAYRGDISPSLGVHTGPGLIGVGIQIIE